MDTAEWRPVVTEVEGRYVAASNATLLGTTADGERVVYKPDAGARPLWDFDPRTLGRREVWTCRLAGVVAPRWVPETVIGDGVYGPGSVQRWVDTDDDFDPLPMVRRGDPALWALAVLDVVCNNADRKLGHILRRSDGTGMVGIDHGLTFHAEDKLRTVLWAFAGRPVPVAELERLEQLRVKLGDEWAAAIGGDLGDDIAEATLARVESLLARRRHPEPPGDRPAYPWPIQ
jgi:hypothetical protein